MALDPNCIFCKIIEGQIPAEIVYLTKNGFIIHLLKYVEDKYTVTIYFKPSQLDEVKFYINSLNKKL